MSGLHHGNTKQPPPTMPPSRKCRSSRTNAPVSLQDKRFGGQMQNKHDEKWNTRFKELFDYRSQHDDCNVPVSQGKLGQWVSNQRRAYMAGSLVQDRINRLNNIGFKWSIVAPVPWETRFHELINYKAKHGDCNIPQSRGPLGTWVKKQRFNYN